ncbi:MAG: bile acid-coenzyme ligase [Actinomycetota bacterium]|jgi:bile acid-coenzyme A ligase
MTSLGEAFARLAATDPDLPAVTHDGRTLTRAELERRTNRLARAYQQLGVVHDSFVTIALPNGIEFVEATIATWKAGATPQPISARLPAREREAIIGLADPSLVVGVDPADAMGRPSVRVGFEPDPALDDGPLAPLVASSWKAPTSGGSTGRPKLIVATQPAEFDQVAPYGGLFLIQDGDVELTTGPLYHNGPFMTAFATLLKGGHTVVMTRFDAATALRLVEEHRVTWMYAVPTMMQRIWRLPVTERERYDISSLRVLYHLAAPCPPWLKEAFIDWLGAEVVWELYAGTEAQAGTVISGAEWLAHRGSVGRPALGEIKILGPDGEELPPGEVGMVWLRRGEDAPPSYRYIGAEAKARDGGWEALGDMGRMDADGYLYLTDRDTDMILVGGANVYPAEVEGALDEHPAVMSSCVIGLPDEDMGSRVHALLQVDADVDEDDLRAFLAERLVTYKIPRSFERVDEPLRDDAGKVRRSALRAARVG